MRIVFSLSGSMIFQAEVAAAPAIGEKAMFVTQNYKKGILPGSLVSVEIGTDDPPIYDYSASGELTIWYDANGLEILQAGPPLDDD